MRTFFLWRLGAGMLAGLVLFAGGCATAPRTSTSSNASSAGGLRRESASGKLSLYFIDVGQGDCTLVIFPDGKRLLVDCGSTNGVFSATRVRNLIKSKLDPQSPRIDLLVITHPDKDHYNKLEEVLGSVSNPQIAVAKVMFSGNSTEYGEDGTDEWLESFPASRQVRISDQSYNHYPAKPLPGFTGAVVLAANVPASFSVSNTRSIVIKVTHINFSAMLAGDATKDTDKKILELYPGAQAKFLDVDVWKAAHHGSWATATHSSKWADVVKPETVVYSASDTNTYGHPNIHLAEEFSSYTTAAPDHNITLWEGQNDPATAAAIKPYRKEAMYLTATNGDITIVSDGVAPPTITFSKP
jgi:competence protein ComEC